MQMKLKYNTDIICFKNTVLNQNLICILFFQNVGVLGFWGFGVLDNARFAVVML